MGATTLKDGRRREYDFQIHFDRGGSNAQVGFDILVDDHTEAARDYLDVLEASQAESREHLTNPKAEIPKATPPRRRTLRRRRPCASWRRSSEETS